MHTCLTLCLPPLKHSQRPKRVPAAGRAKPFQIEIRLASIFVVQRPATILALAGAHNFDRLRKARVGRRIDGLEIVQSAEDVVVPARWERKMQENRLDDFAGAVGAKEPVTEQ